MLAIIKRIPGVKFLYFLLVCFVFFQLVLVQKNSLVKPSAAITPQETRLASKVAKKLADKLASKHSSIEITIENNELSAVAKMASHLLPKTQVVLTTSNIGILLASSTQVNLPFKRYLNITCLVSQTAENSKLHDCKIGYLPIYGSLLEWIALTGFSVVLGEDFADTAQDLLANIEYSNASIKLHAKKSKFLKEQVNQSMSRIGDFASSYQQNATVDKETIVYYLNELNKVKSSELAPYVGASFSLAQERSKYNDPVEENTAVLWALAIKFGDYHFASLMGLKANKSYSAVPTTRGRVDLTQHFIYSAILDQLGDLDVGLAIGEAKELLDSLKGGSGFSFSDLAADKAGLKISHFSTSNKNNALYTQKLLANVTTEDAYFPFIHDLPDGFKDKDYQKVISSIESKNYRYVETEIDKRINKLAVYNKNNTIKRLHKNIAESKSEQWLPPSEFNQFKFWHKVDTNIHSDFSDGRHSINEIAEKAHLYGCEAIAITDSGDLDFTNVLSSKYFNTVQQANERFPLMTVMPGLEWNIPPFRGREHVTVILPNTVNQQKNLNAFRNRFDQFKRYDEKLLSPEQAFQWLNEYGHDNSATKPLVMYNHPSKKDAQQRENLHDFTYWRQFTDLMVGFSGAPGHQKQQGKNHGGYNRYVKTVNGWDPVVENVGGEWDQLLQQGYKVWGARATSNFQNTKTDYWPCEYSSTHVLSKTNNHNDILQGFQSGAYWAQHGNFVKSLAFNIKTANNTLVMGNAANVNPKEQVNIQIAVELNVVNWRIELVSLNELELIVITDNNIETIKLDITEAKQNTVTINYPYIIKSENTVFRLRGKSTTSKQRNLMFYSNPIKLIRVQ